MTAAATTAPTYLADLDLATGMPVEHLADLSVDLEPAQLIATRPGCG